MSDKAQNGRRAKKGRKKKANNKKNKEQNISAIDPDTFDLLTFLLQSNFIL